MLRLFSLILSYSSCLSFRAFSHLERLSSFDLERFFHSDLRSQLTFSNSFQFTCTLCLLTFSLCSFGTSFFLFLYNQTFFNFTRSFVTFIFSSNTSFLSFSPSFYFSLFCDLHLNLSISLFVLPATTTKRTINCCITASVVNEWCLIDFTASVHNVMPMALLALFSSVDSSNRSRRLQWQEHQTVVAASCLLPTNQMSLGLVAVLLLLVG